MNELKTEFVNIITPAYRHAGFMAGVKWKMREWKKWKIRNKE